MSYPPKPQPGQQKDPMLDGLLSQPQQPSQPSPGGQTGNWGGGNNWWGGASGVSGPAAPQTATTGFGAYDPNPNPVHPITQPADPGVPETPATPATPATPQQPVDPNKGYREMLQRQLLDAQNNLRMVQQHWANAPGMKADRAISQAQHAIMVLQNKLSQAGLASHQGGY